MCPLLNSGAGGLDEGLKKAGFEIVFANDFDKNACKTYEANHGDHIECGDIDLLKNDLLHFRGKVDLIAGGDLHVKDFQLQEKWIQMILEVSMFGHFQTW